MTLSWRRRPGSWWTTRRSTIENINLNMEQGRRSCRPSWMGRRRSDPGSSPPSPSDRVRAMFFLSVRRPACSGRCDAVVFAVSRRTSYRAPSCPDGPLLLAAECAPSRRRPEGPQGVIERVSARLRPVPRFRALTSVSRLGLDARAFCSLRRGFVALSLSCPVHRGGFFRPPTRSLSSSTCGAGRDAGRETELIAVGVEATIGA